MAKEEKHGGKSGKKPKKLHLHEIRSTYAKDGTVVHHHTYKDDAEADYAHPERGPVATSATPDEAGQHVAEQFAMNGGQGADGGGQEPDGDEAQAGAGAEPQGGGAPPEEGE